MLGCGGTRAGPAPRQAPGSVLVPRPAGRCQQEGALQSPLNLRYRRGSQLGLLICSCCRRLMDALDVLVLASPKSLRDAACRNCDRQCRGYLASAKFGAHREDLVATAQHLCPGAPQPSILGSQVPPRSPRLGTGSTKLTWPHFTEHRRCWGSPHQAEHWPVGYSPWQEGTCGLRPFTGWEQEQKDLLGTALLGVWSLSQLWGLPATPLADPGDPRPAEHPQPGRREVPQLLPTAPMPRWRIQATFPHPDAYPAG